MRAIAFMLLVSGSAAHATMIESDWTQPPSPGFQAGLVIADGKMHAIGTSLDFAGSARRGWINFSPTLSAHWAVEAHVHLDNLQLPVQRYQFVKMGIEVGRRGTATSLATLALGFSPDLPEAHQRYIQSGYKLGAFGGRSDAVLLPGTDALLKLTYSAHDRLVRTYFKSASGTFVPINTYSSDGWGISTDEPLELRIFTEPWFAPLAQGQVYVQDFRVVPEPATSHSIALTALICLIAHGLRTANRRFGSPVLVWSRPQEGPEELTN